MYTMQRSALSQVLTFKPLPVYLYMPVTTQPAAVHKKPKKYYTASIDHSTYYICKATTTLQIYCYMVAATDYIEEALTKRPWKNINLSRGSTYTRHHLRLPHQWEQSSCWRVYRLHLDLCRMVPLQDLLCIYLPMVQLNSTQKLSGRQAQYLEYLCS